MRINDRAMISTLSIGQWTARKLDKTATREVSQNHNSSEDWGRYNKSLVAKDSLKAIQQAANAARTFHYENTLPWNDQGGRILPAAHYLAYSEKMRQFKEAFFSEVSLLLSNYPYLIQEAQRNLNGLFNQEEYPEASAIESKFSFEIDILPIPSGDDFRVSLDAEQTAAIKSEIETRLQKSTETAMRDLWQRLHEAVSHMADKLSQPDAIFKNSLVGNVSDICNLLPKLNITDDANLETMRQEVLSRLTTETPDRLRNCAAARAQAAADAKAIADKMAAFM
jgi:hypothetical protein